MDSESAAVTGQLESRRLLPARPGRAAGHGDCSGLVLDSVEVTFKFKLLVTKVGTPTVTQSAAAAADSE